MAKELTIKVSYANKRDPVQEDAFLTALIELAKKHPKEELDRIKQGQTKLRALPGGK